MTTKKQPAFVRIENQRDGRYRMFCSRCGGEMFITPPIALKEATVMMKQFAREHKHCAPPAPEEPTP